MLRLPHSSPSCTASAPHNVSEEPESKKPELEAILGPKAKSEIELPESEKPQIEEPKAKKPQIEEPKAEKPQIEEPRAAKETIVIEDAPTPEAKKIKRQGEEVKRKRIELLKPAVCN